MLQNTFRGFPPLIMSELEGCHSDLHVAASFFPLFGGKSLRPVGTVSFFSMTTDKSHASILDSFGSQGHMRVTGHGNGPRQWT